MLTIIFNLICLHIIVVFIIDVSGFVDNAKAWMASLLTNGKIKTKDYRIKPFDCSLCMNFWTSIIYLICVSQFTLPYLALTCCLSFLTTITKDVFFVIRDKITILLNDEEGK